MTRPCGQSPAGLLLFCILTGGVGRRPLTRCHTEMGIGGEAKGGGTGYMFHPKYRNMFQKVYLDFKVA